MAVRCQECGFLNAESANYCQRCGAALARGEGSADPATATYRIDDETGELIPVELDEVTARGPALVVRAGGGREGESFPVLGERMSIGRRLDSDVFLDDVTVSRRHVVIDRDAEGYVLRDVGSLNGTYVNRKRVDRARLKYGDEVQIGRYRLTFVVGGEREREG